MVGRDVVVLSGVRTAVGKYGGSLKDMPPADLGAMVVREAVARSGVEPSEVGHTVFGNVIHTETRDMYLSRVASASRSRPRRSP
jgi:acetyl-CoA C-acetyltransferase